MGREVEDTGLNGWVSLRDRADLVERRVEDSNAGHVAAVGDRTDDREDTGSTKREVATCFRWLQAVPLRRPDCSRSWSAIAEPGSAPAWSTAVGGASTGT